MSNNTPTPPASALTILLSLIRTIVPLLVGQLLTWLLSLGVVVSDDLATQLHLFVLTIVTSLYYAGVRWLETHASAKFGWLLGAPVAPSGYANESPAARG